MDGLDGHDGLDRAGQEATAFDCCIVGICMIGKALRKSYSTSTWHHGSCPW